MSRYTVQQLLHLRESPLVQKPDALPPTEQWMGPPIDSTQRKVPTTRNKTDELGAGDSNKRPTLLETQGTRRSTTENILLGSSKVGFPSSINARPPSKGLDPNELFPNKGLGKDLDADEREGERRGGRLGGANGRRNDREDWGMRPRRPFDGDDNERKPRRNIDRDREGLRWDSKRDQGEAGEEAGHGHRQSHGKGRFENPWFRGENGTPASEEDPKMPPRDRAWGRDRRSGLERDNDWNTRVEQDPEWMGSGDVDEPKQAHTVEDFQKWKERMRADNEKRIPTDNIQGPTGTTAEDSAAKPAQLKIKPDSDKFFELFGGEKKGPEESAAAAETKKQKTRFAALFSPAAEVPKMAAELKPKEVPVVERPERPASSDADQEGFQRILQMLGGKSRTNAPSLEQLLGSNPPVQRSEQNTPNPLVALLGGTASARSEASKSPENRTQARNIGGLESLISPRSPRNDQKREGSSNRDSDLLLRLMQQSKISPSPQPSQEPPPQSSHIPGILQMPEHLSRARQPAKSPGSKLPSFFDDPAISNVQRPPPQADRADPRQRHNSHTQAKDYEQFSARPEFLQGSQEVGSGPAGMISRPPGFDTMMLPGWLNQPRQGSAPIPQQGPATHGSATAPPGVPNSTSRGMPFPGSMPPNMNILPPQGGPPHERQRKYTGGNGVNAPSFPPGMAPPPGFIGNPGGNGPPPGFPPMPMSHDGFMGMGQQGGMGLRPNPQGLPPQHLMELFAMERNGGGRGPGGGIPGPYR